MTQNNIVYRPIWTTGRYNEEHRVAIYYNLLEGMSYFFEKESAKVIEAILNIGRNKCVSIDDIVQFTGIEVTMLQPFLEELAQLNLITFSPITKEGIENYRTSLSEWKKDNFSFNDRVVKDKLPFETTSAEMAYADKAKDIFGVMFEMTYNCSEKCIHCYNIGATRNDSEESHRVSINEMTLKDYKKAIDQLYAAGIVKVTLSGGDPFSKDCIWEVIDYLFEKGIAFDVYTNGQRLVGKENRLASYYPRLVSISIYSPVEEIHDKITRIRGSFDKSMNVLQGLSDLAVPLNIKCCVMRPNLKTYRKINNIAKRLGAFPQFELCVTDSVDGDKCVSKFLRLSEEQYELVLRDSNTPLYVGSEAPNFGGQPKDMKHNGCGAGYDTFCITPNGDVVPCCAFHMPVGNITREHITHILKSSKLLEWKGSILMDYEECGKHDYCAYCNLCPGLGYAEHGDWKKAAENCCFIAKIRYNLALKMMAGNDPLEGESLDQHLKDLEEYSFVKIQRTI